MFRRVQRHQRLNLASGQLNVPRLARDLENGRVRSRRRRYERGRLLLNLLDRVAFLADDEPHQVVGHANLGRVGRLAAHFERYILAEVLGVAQDARLGRVHVLLPVSDDEKDGLLRPIRRLDVRMSVILQLLYLVALFARDDGHVLRTGNCNKSAMVGLFFTGAGHDLH